MPILECLWQFAPTASHLLGLQQVSFHTVHQDWHIIPRQRLSSALKQFSNTGKFSIPLQDPPANLKKKTLIYNFSKVCWLNHINSCPHLPSPNSIRVLPVPHCTQTGTTLHPVFWISPPGSLSCPEVDITPVSLCPPDMTIASMSYETSRELHPAFPRCFFTYIWSSHLADFLENVTFIISDHWTGWADFTFMYIPGQRLFSRWTLIFSVWDQDFYSSNKILNCLLQGHSKRAPKYKFENLSQIWNWSPQKGRREKGRRQW